MFLYFDSIFVTNFLTMALQLAKVEAGQRINLSKDHAGLKKVKIGLSWDVKEGLSADLDASLLVLGSNEKMLSEESILFYNSPKNVQGKPILYNGALEHSGDERSGAADGDDETITVDLTKMPADVVTLLATITIYDDDFIKKRTSQQVTFGRVKNASVRIYNAETNQALYQFDLSEDASRATSIEMARIYLVNGEWRFTALGDIIGTSPNGLEDIVNKYKR